MRIARRPLRVDSRPLASHLMSAELEAGRIPAPSKGAQLPGELLELILHFLCVDEPEAYEGWGDLSFESSLAPCSLTCRRWAAQIRPVLFSKVVLRSQEDVRSFASFVRSSAAVPGPLRLVVRDINLVMARSSRPWMYHIWALLRDVALPNLRAIDLQVAGVNQGDQSEVGWHRCDESLLDIGLPRTLPSTRPLHLRTLSLKNLLFRSHKTLLRCLTYHCTEHISCSQVKWSEGGTVPEPAGRLLSRLSSHPPSEVSVHYCTAISPFIWRFVTTHLPAPGAAKRLLYVSAEQIDPVMGILRLFNDECECRRCNGKAEEVDYELQVYTDPTDGSLRCLSVGPEFSHMLTMQIEPSGTVSRVCLMMDDPSYFLPPSENPPSYPPAAPDSTLTRLDQLCESLGATLRDVVIAYFPFHAQDPIPPAELASAMRGLRAQMPGTSRRRRLVLRTSRKAWEDFRDEHVEYDTVSERVFERGGSYWADVVLDDQQAAPLEPQVDLSVRV